MNNGPSDQSIPPGPVLSLLSKTSHSDGFATYVEGEVTNTCSVPLKSVQAVVTFVDGGGNFITSADGYLTYDPLLPNQTSPFKVMLTQSNPSIASFRIEFKQYDGAKLDFIEGTSSGAPDATSSSPPVGGSASPGPPAEFVPKTEDERQVLALMKPKEVGWTIMDIAVVSPHWATGVSAAADSCQFICHKVNGKWLLEDEGRNIQDEFTRKHPKLSKDILDKLFPVGE